MSKLGKNKSVNNNSSADNNKNKTDDDKLKNLEEKESKKFDENGNDSFRDGAVSEDIEDVQDRILKRMEKSTEKLAVKTKNNSVVDSKISNKIKNQDKFVTKESSNISDDFKRNITNINNKAINDSDEGKETSSRKDKNEVEDGEDLVVLDPEHPQMKRFQKSLKDLLEKQTTKITLEINQLNEALKVKKVERESVGVQLYNVQQELIRQQTQLVKHQGEFQKLNVDRQRSEIDVLELKKKFEGKLEVLNREKKKISQLQVELENLNNRYFYLENAGGNISGDVALLKRAALKSNKEINKAEEFKQKQDLFVDKLTKKVISLTEELEDLKDQLANQIEDTKLAKDALNESLMELQEVIVEKQRLMQEWDKCVLGLRKRDETYNKMMGQFNQLEERIQTLTSEIDGTKGAIAKEQEVNEKYMEVLSRLQFDIDRVEKDIITCKQDVEKIQESCIRVGRILAETEVALQKINEEKKELGANLEILRKQTEKCNEEKLKIEGRLMEKMQDQANLDKASKITDKIISKNAEKTRDLESQIVKLENEMTKKSFEETQVTAEIAFLQKNSVEMKDEINEKNELITKTEQEIIKRNVIIERKQSQLDLLSKKLDNLLTQSGGLELGPLELQINSLKKSITTTHKDIKDAQQIWLKNQAELVKMATAKNEEEVGIENLKNRIMVYQQKLMRVEGDVERQKKELTEIERNISEIRNDTTKLNTLMVKERVSGEAMQQDHKLTVKKYEADLNDAERELIELQGRLEGLMEEKGRMLEAIMEAEKQIVLWEKKIQLAEEAMDSVDGESVKSEMGRLKNEYHRMEVRLNQINRECEKKCLEMERLVACREVNLIKGEARGTKGQTKVKDTLTREVTDLKKKIKEKQKETERNEKELKQLEDEKDELNEKLQNERMKLEELHNLSEQLDQELQRISGDKYLAFIDTFVGQQKIKNFQQLSKTTPAANATTKTTKTSPEVEYRKQLDRMQDVVRILNKLSLEYPEAKRDIRRVVLTYGSRVLNLME